MLDIGLGHLDVLASTASDQGFKVKLVKSNGRENDVRKQKCRSRWQGLRRTRVGVAGPRRGLLAGS